MIPIIYLTNCQASQPHTRGGTELRWPNFWTGRASARWAPRSLRPDRLTCRATALRDKPMQDFQKTIQQLRIQKETVERAILSLEGLLKPRRNADLVQKRRGRKGMGPEERQERSPTG